jgi:hypothetical protein
LSNEFDLATSGPGSNRVNNVINAYFVPQIANVRVNPDGTPNNPIDQTHGVATSARTNPRTFGLFVSDPATNGMLIAH